MDIQAYITPERELNLKFDFPENNIQTTGDTEAVSNDEDSPNVWVYKIEVKNTKS